jgi:hypothetical protein
MLCVTGVLALGGGVFLWKEARDSVVAVDTAQDYTTFANKSRSAEPASVYQGVGIGAMVVGSGLVLAGLIHYAVRPEGGGRVAVGGSLLPGGGMVSAAGAF